MLPLPDIVPASIAALQAAEVANPALALAQLEHQQEMQVKAARWVTSRGGPLRAPRRGRHRRRGRPVAKQSGALHSNVFPAESPQLPALFGRAAAGGGAQCCAQAAPARGRGCRQACSHARCGRPPSPLAAARHTPVARTAARGSERAAWRPALETCAPRLSTAQAAAIRDHLRSAPVMGQAGGAPHMMQGEAEAGDGEARRGGARGGGARFRRGLGRQRCGRGSRAFGADFSRLRRAAPQRAAGRPAARSGRAPAFAAAAPAPRQRQPPLRARARPKPPNSRTPFALPAAGNSASASDPAGGGSEVESDSAEGQ